MSELRKNSHHGSAKGGVVPHIAKNQSYQLRGPGPVLLIHKLPSFQPFASTSIGAWAYRCFALGERMRIVFQS